MNYHSDDWVMEKIQEHYNEALEYFPKDRIVGIFCQGSTNYGLDTYESDVDTKLVITPTFDDIVFNYKPTSTTHIRANNEHIDFKDIRLMLQTFRKQNLNFLEILFTDFKIVNPIYEKEWNRLVEQNEAIAHYNKAKAVKAMTGMAIEKHYAMELKYPSKIEVIDKYGYDPKQLHHLLRIEDYLHRYINGELYAKCMKPTDPQYLKSVKAGLYNLKDAREIAENTLASIKKMCEPFVKNSEWDCNDEQVDILLNDVQRNIMKIAIY